MTKGGRRQVCRHRSGADLHGVVG